MENAQVLSQKCEQDTKTFLRELHPDKAEETPVHINNASGMTGSYVDGGDAEQQCHSFFGQYCQLSYEQADWHMGVCVPDSCGENEVQILVLTGRLQFNKSLIPPFPPILVNQPTQEKITTRCLTSPDSPDASRVICLVVCCVMIALPLTATLITAIMRWQRNREVSPTSELSCVNTDQDLYGTLKSNGTSSSEVSASEDSSRPTQLCVPQTCLYGCLQAFSLQTTSQGVFSTSSPIPGEDHSLHGIRVLSILWIMCFNSGHIPLANTITQYKDLKNIFESSSITVVFVSGPAHLAVDTFLVMSGLLSARTLLGAIDRAEGKLSPSVVADYLFNRIRRVQPLHLFILSLSIIFLPPVVKVAMKCRSSWWANVLLINNLFPYSEICIPWTWYLSLDFQCSLVTPVLICFYRLSWSVFVVVSGGLLLITSVASAVITALMKLPVILPTDIPNDDYFTHYYVKPYTRYGPFLIGILVGIHLTTKKDQLLKKRWQAALGWFCSLALMAVVIVLAYVLRETPACPSAPHALYQALHREVWALAVTWIILACEEGHGGFIKSFLSSSLWLPLSNISFACYLTHNLIINIYLLNVPIHYSDMNFMYMFFGHLMLTLVVSSVLTVLVEKPFILLKCGSK